MSAGAPWSVKGIDPKAREVAKDLARRSGMTLGEWLNSMIMEDEDGQEPLSESEMRSSTARMRETLSSIQEAIDDLSKEPEVAGPTREEFEARLREAEARAETREVGMNAKLDRLLDKVDMLTAQSAKTEAAAEDAKKATVTTRWNVLAIIISSVLGLVAIVLAVNALMVSTAEMAAGSKRDVPSASTPQTQ